MRNKGNKEDDYDFDMEAALVENGMIEDLFYLKDLKQRKIFLEADVDQFSVGDIVRHILRFNKCDKGISEDKRQPILLYVASNGGDVDAGFELIDTIMSSKTPVYTINLGYWYSMGMLIGLAGDKRYAMPNSKLLMHDGSHFILNSGAKAQDQMRFQSKVEERVKDYILSRSNVTSEEYDDKLRVEWYMFADEAQKRGFVDYIIGVDCDIDDIA